MASLKQINRDNIRIIRDKVFETNVQKPIIIDVIEGLQDQDGSATKDDVSIVLFKGTPGEAVQHFCDGDSDTNCVIMNFPNSQDFCGEKIDNFTTQEEELCRTIIDLEQSLPHSQDAETSWDTHIKYTSDLSLYRLDKKQSNGTYTFINDPPERIPVSVVTATPPDLRNDSELKATFLSDPKIISAKIKDILKTVCLTPIFYAKTMPNVLILGAFGCGEMGPSLALQRRRSVQYANLIASLFARVIIELPNYMSMFDTVCFAIPPGKITDAFETSFTKFEISYEIIVPNEDEEEEEEEIIGADSWDLFGINDYVSPPQKSHSDLIRFTHSHDSDLGGLFDNNDDWPTQRRKYNNHNNHYNRHHRGYSYDDFDHGGSYGGGYYGGYSAWKPLGERKENDFSGFKEKIKEEGDKAITEIQKGLKLSHWMWYMFPQITGLGFSDKSSHYGIKSFDEAKTFFQDKELKEFLTKITTEVQIHLATSPGKTVKQIFGFIDCDKFLSCMTLFYYVAKDLNDEESTEMFEFCKDITEKELKTKDKKTMKMCGEHVSPDTSSIATSGTYTYRSYSSYGTSSGAATSSAATSSAATSSAATSSATTSNASTSDTSESKKNDNSSALIVHPQTVAAEASQKALDLAVRSAAYNRSSSPVQRSYDFWEKMYM
jgi:uncharacterized protein (DUF1810 family)